MTRDKLIEKNPELFLEIIKEGVELALNGCTDFQSPHDVERANEEIKHKWDMWDDQEQEFLKLI
jgi:hypothetical protein